MPDYSGIIAQSDIHTQMVKAVYVVSVSAAVVSGSAQEIGSFTPDLVDRQTVFLTNLDPTNTVYVGFDSGLTSTLLWHYNLGEGERAVLQVGGSVNVYVRSSAGTPTITITQML